MSLCTRYLIHLSHGNNFSNGEPNPPFFAPWWSFFLFCLLRSCHQLHRHFKMLPQKGHGQKSTGLRHNHPFPQQTPRSAPAEIALSLEPVRGAQAAKPMRWLSPACSFILSSYRASTGDPMLQMSIPLSGDRPSQGVEKLLQFSGGSRCLVMGAHYF